MREEFNLLRDTIVMGDIEGAASQVGVMMEKGENPVLVFSECVEPTLNDLGEKFSRLEIFLPELMIAADVVDAIQAVVKPYLKGDATANTQKGSAVIATVYGDLHDIGKNMVSLMMQVNGIETYDLGVDVTPRDLIKKAEEVNADLLCLSGLMVPSLPFMRETIELARANEKIGNHIKVMVGGGPVTQGWADTNGADGYADDAIGAVKLALELAKK
jgi:5-methyltetrahydrofolate--homocysteine methyltransferase